MRKTMFFIALIGLAATWIVVSQDLPSELDDTYGQMQAEGGTISTVKVSGNVAGNCRWPAVAENGKGERLVIFRGGDARFWYSVWRGTTWSTPLRIPNQDINSDYWFTDIVADYSDNFHAVWEVPDKTVYYARYNGKDWTNPREIDGIGKDDGILNLAVRSTDELVLASTEKIPGVGKEIILSFKKPSEPTLMRSINITQDKESSAMGWVAVDADDGLWVVYKGEYDKPEWPLETVLFTFDRNNKFLSYKNVSEQNSWNFYQQVAINRDGKVMTAWVLAHQQYSYCSRLYDPATKQWGGIQTMPLAIPISPWSTFYIRLIAHDRDFYYVALDGSRFLYISKYNQTAKQWGAAVRVSNQAVAYLDASDGYDKILMTYNTFHEPTEVYVATMAVEPPDPGTLTVTSPNGNEEWELGTSHNITWTSEDVLGRIDIILLHNSHVIGTIAEDLMVSDGSYTWNVGDYIGGVAEIGSGFRIRLQHKTGIPVDDSDHDFFIDPKIKSALNVQVQKKLEQSLFKGYYINHVTWEANPANDDNEIVVDHYNLYRKLKTDELYGTTPYQANIPASTLSLDDTDGIDAELRHDYYATCVTIVDGKEIESKIVY